MSKRRPFWLPGSTYYFLSAAVAIAIFFLVWGILMEGRGDSPWIIAGLVSSVSMITAVVIREVVLRTRRNRVVAAQRMLDNSVLSIPSPARKESDPRKLTLEKNSLLLKEIRRKSAAANVLARLPESHREVFLLCEGYIEAATRELPFVGVGSPRLAALTRGRSEAELLHRSHMLAWAELEATGNTMEAAATVRTELRLEKAKKALFAVDTALRSYPDESSLRDSRVFLEEMLSSIKFARSIERAERAETNNSLERALKYYKEAERMMKKGVIDLDDAQATRLSDNIARLEKAIGEL
ncbi:MAG: hypothetical protein AB7V18_01185 [Pyrinomonadaceae bacterium]